MKKPILVSLILILLMLVMTETGLARFTDLPGSQGKNGKKSDLQLFNGKNLDGWYTYIQGKGRNNDPNKVFAVVNGLIRISGEEFGCITTNDEFENYKLSVKFKWGDITYSPRVEKARDSGILLHSVGEDGSSSGTWMYSIECLVKNKEIFIYLNGTLVNHAVDIQPQKGRIQIQSEGAEIFFKRISITSL